MVATLPPRAVIVSRPSEYELLLARHGTREQARFFLAHRGQDLAVVEERHALQVSALETVSAAVPSTGRRAQVTRADLDRFHTAFTGQEPCKGYFKLAVREKED